MINKEKAMTKIQWDPLELELHNSAWKIAKSELLGSVDANIPASMFSIIALRAEVIRGQFKERK